jgi:hypothetical protein
VTDRRGRRVALGTVRLDGLPGTAHTTSRWGQDVRLALPRRAPALAALELTPGAGTRAWLLDAWAWRPGTPPPRAAALTRADLVHGRIVVTGRGAGRVRIYRYRSAVEAVVRAGAPVRLRHVRAIQPVRHAVVGAYR